MSWRYSTFLGLVLIIAIQLSLVFLSSILETILQEVPPTTSDGTAIKFSSNEAWEDTRESLYLAKLIDRMLKPIPDFLFPAFWKVVNGMTT